MQKEIDRPAPEEYNGKRGVKRKGDIVGGDMTGRSDLEDFIETAFKHPLFGIICSAVLACVGYFLTNGEAQAPDAEGIMFFPTIASLGRFFYFASAAVAALSVSGYACRLAKRKRDL